MYLYATATEIKFIITYRQCFICQLSVLTYKALHTGQPCCLADLIDLYEPSTDVCNLLIVTFLLFLPVLNNLWPPELFVVYLCLIIGILSLCTSAHLTVLSLFNPTFSLLPITSSHPHASASDSTFDFWCYINT